MAKGKRSGKNPMQQNIEFVPLLKKPMDAIGKQIKIPGSYWGGRMTADVELANVGAPTVLGFPTVLTLEQ